MVARKRVWVALCATAILATAAGVAVNRVGGSTRSQLTWFSVASLLFLAGGAVARWSAVGKGDGRIRLRTADSKDRPVQLGDATLGELGVHWSGTGEDGFGPYVSRDVDPVLDDAVRSGQPLVIVVGGALAGRTRTLAEAARRHEASSWLAWFEDVPGAKLAELVTVATEVAHSDPVVLWLENPPLGMLSQLSPRLLDGLPPSLRIFMTIDSHLVNVGVLAGDAAEVLNSPGTSIELGPVTESERARLAGEPVYRALVEAHRDQPVLMGQLMISLDRVISALQTPDNDAICRAAVLHAAVDWQRIGVPFPLTRETIEKLYRGGYWQELADRGRRAAASRSGFRVAIKRLLEPAPSWGLRLLDEVYSGASIHLRPHPLLTVVADSPQQPPGWPVSEVLWRYLADTLDGSGRVIVGLTAATRGDYRHAGSLMETADPAAIPADVKLKIAFEASGSGDVASARRWFEKVVESGHDEAAPKAMVNLGVLEMRQSRIEEGRSWFVKAAEGGHLDSRLTAMLNLGVLNLKLGRIEEARGWFVKVAESGHDRAPTAMLNLGVLEKEQDRIEQARGWYAKAIERGHTDAAPNAMLSLGSLERDQDRIEEARGWFARAIESHHADAAPMAMVNLGALELEQGRVQQARSWYAKAAESGHDVAPDAMNTLGFLERDQNRIEEARGWFARAIESHHADAAPMAMVNLGALELEQGRIQEARNRLTSAIQSHHPGATPKAMANLGVLELGQDQIEEARGWFARAIESHHPEAAPRAMYNLGVLEMRQGRIQEARNWFMKVTEGGDLEAAQLARHDLDTLQRHDEDMERAEQFAKYAHPYIDADFNPPSAASDPPGDDRPTA